MYVGVKVHKCDSCHIIYEYILKIVVLLYNLSYNLCCPQLDLKLSPFALYKHMFFEFFNFI